MDWTVRVIDADQLFAQKQALNNVTLSQTSRVNHIAITLHFVYIESLRHRVRLVKPTLS